MHQQDILILPAGCWARSFDDGASDARVWEGVVDRPLRQDLSSSSPPGTGGGRNTPLSMCVEVPFVDWMEGRLKAKQLVFGGPEFIDSFYNVLLYSY